MRLAFLMFCVLLGGCAASIKGTKHEALVDCSGAFKSWSDCVAAADDYCFDNHGYIAKWRDDTGGRRIMRIRCGGA